MYNYQIFFNKWLYSGVQCSSGDDLGAAIGFVLNGKFEVYQVKQRQARQPKIHQDVNIALWAFFATGKGPEYADLNRVVRPKDFEDDILLCGSEHFIQS
jgi:hypothetical protein